MDVFRIVSATRVPKEEFPTKTALGRSLQRFQSFSNLEQEIYYNNSEGLSTIYNRSILQAHDHPAILIFVHDDVFISDLGLMIEIQKTLKMFDIVGLAGNKRRLPRQPAWPFIDANFTWDRPENLSGIVGHGEPPGNFSIYGPVHQKCKLLDGVMLICTSEKLKSANLLFDPQFTFNFYDMDFCRQAELRGLTLGTADIKIVHQSGGAFGSHDWRASYKKYLDKYGG